MSSQNFSRTISYKGQFDASGIIKGLQQIRQQLGQSTTKQSLFVDVDDELKRVNNLSKQIQAAIQKGFSNPQDLKNFEKAIGQLEASLGRVSSKLQRIDLSIVAQSAEKANEKFKEQKALLGTIVSSQQASIKSQLEGIKGATDYTRRIVAAAKSGKELQEIQSQITSELQRQVNTQKSKVNLAQQEVNEAKKNLETEIVKGNAGLSLGRGSFADTTKITDKGQMSNISAEQLASVRKEYAKILAEMKSSDDAEAAMKKLEKALDNLGIKIRNPTRLTAEFAQSFQKLPGSVTPALQNLKAAEQALDKANKTLLEIQARQGSTTSAFNSQELQDAYERIRVKALEVADAQRKYNEESKRTGSHTSDLQRLNALMAQLSGNTRRNAQATREATQAQQQYDNTFENLKRYIQYTFSLTNGFRMLRRVISKTLTDIKNLDKSFADIAMVTDYSVAEMWESYDQYAQMANELGQSTQDVIKASGLFYQQGLDTAESLALTTETMKLATLAGIDFEEATSQMTAAIRGFNMEMDEGQRVTDVYSELAAKAAADVEGIAYAMSKTASIANSAGMSFENTAAFLTQMIEVK